MKKNNYQILIMLYFFIIKITLLICYTMDLKYESFKSFLAFKSLEKLFAEDVHFINIPCIIFFNCTDDFIKNINSYQFIVSRY